MKKEIYLKALFDPKENSEVIIENLGKTNNIVFSEYYPESVSDLNDKIKERLYKNGLSKTLELETFSNFIGKPGDNKDHIVFHLQKYLDNVILTDHLTIIDGYFFSSTNDKEYEGFVFDILKKYLHDLKSIRIITKKNEVDKNVKNNLISKIKEYNNEIIVTHKNCKLFHDRFWISDFTKSGLFIGTSLNGLGKKYCLVDYIDSSDVEILRNELQNLNL